MTTSGYITIKQAGEILKDDGVSNVNAAHILMTMIKDPKLAIGKTYINDHCGFIATEIISYAKTTRSFVFTTIMTIL